MKDDFLVLARLWLHEPNADLIEQAQTGLGLPFAEQQELAVAYSDLFLLNVYPYASLFLEPTGEMNGTRAQQVAALYEEYAYAPSELNAVGAADHIGLMLGMAGEIGQDSILPFLMDWAPVLCLAVERAPTTHPFYQTLAARTRELLFSENRKSKIENRKSDIESPISNFQILPDEDQELSTRAVVHYLLTPARSGMFLTRARLGLWGRALGAPLAFGERFQVGLALLESAGATGQVAQALNWLRAEVEMWDAAYAQWASEYEWRYAAMWSERTTNTLRLLEEMNRLLETSPILNADEIQ